MLKLLNAKILLAILAAIVALGAVLVHERQVQKEQAAAAARAAMLLQQQQDAAAAAKKHDDEMREEVRQKRLRSNAMPANGSKPWTHYLP